MRITICITLLMISTFCFSQLDIVETKEKEEIGKVKKLLTTYMETYKQGDIYTFRYKDMSYEHVNEWKSFSITEESFKELYVLILKNFQDPPEDRIMINLKGKGSITLNYTTNLGITSFFFMHAIDNNADIIGQTTYMNKKDINKLFGVDR